MEQLVVTVPQAHLVHLELLALVEPLVLMVPAALQELVELLV